MISKSELANKIKNIKIFITDCDGVLTDGKLFYQGDDIGWGRFFHARDGHGMRILKRFGIQTGIISGGDSLGLKERITHLDLDYCYLGNEDKNSALHEIKKKSGFDFENMLYIGDDYFDIPLLQSVGLAATVPGAPQIVKKYCHYITKKVGGDGAVRELVELFFEVNSWEVKIKNLKGELFKL